jgi:hypothetical protein
MGQTPPTTTRLADHCACHPRCVHHAPSQICSPFAKPRTAQVGNPSWLGGSPIEIGLCFNNDAATWPQAGALIADGCCNYSENSSTSPGTHDSIVKPPSRTHHQWLPLRYTNLDVSIQQECDEGSGDLQRRHCRWFRRDATLRFTASIELPTCTLHVHASTMHPTKERTSTRKSFLFSNTRNRCGVPWASQALYSFLKYRYSYFQFSIMFIQVLRVLVRFTISLPGTLLPITIYLALRRRP